MPIDVRWDDTHDRVILWNMNGTITSEDFWQAQDISFEMTGSVTERVDMIVLTDPTLQLPSGFMSTLESGSKRVQRMSSNAVALTMIVGNSPFAKAFVSLFLRLYPVAGWESVASLEVAYARIVADRAK